MEKELYKTRSLSACVHDAFALYCNNFSTLFKCTWLPVLVLSLALALINRASSLLASQSAIAVGCGAIALLIVNIFLGSWFDSGYIHLLNKQTVRHNYRKCCRVRLFFSICVIAIMAIAGIGCAATIIAGMQAKTNIGQATGLGMLVAAALLVVLFLLLIPFLYPMVQYLVTDAAKMKPVFKQGYRTGWKSYGFLFGITAISTLIATIFAVVLAMPSIPLYISDFVNNQGMALGDASALPKTFNLLKALANLIASFGYSYLVIWLFLVQYYAYGSITARNKERSLQTTNATQS